jgi:hypothetical protein
VVGDGEFEFPIVGESHYQRALESIVGGKTERGHEHVCAALLLPEPANPYDKNAVCVKIRQLTVGHLARDVAQDFALALRQRGFSRAAAEAMIVGGWRRRGGDEGHFGVKLNAITPFAFSDPADYLKSLDSKRS